MHIIVGLGNPGEKYESTRHNTGRILLRDFADSNSFPDFVNSGKYQALISEGKVGKEKVLLMMPETFMNKSGGSLKSLIKTKKGAEQLIVIYDDMDLPLGTMRIAFGRGSGGHNGVESIIKTLKTKDFVRIRVGVSPATPGGKLRKPKGEKAVIDFLMGDFKKAETDALKKEAKVVRKMLETLILEGRAIAMNTYN
jgi:peptidyl-tRNA hydrolase, PTH1 family